MKKLIILMHSMRSHETGEYQIMLDSNINIILHQLSVLPKDVEVTVNADKELYIPNGKTYPPLVVSRVKAM